MDTTNTHNQHQSDNIHTPHTPTQQTNITTQQTQQEQQQLNPNPKNYDTTILSTTSDSTQQRRSNRERTKPTQFVPTEKPRSYRQDRKRYHSLYKQRKSSPHPKHPSNPHHETTTTRRHSESSLSSTNTNIPIPDEPQVTILKQPHVPKKTKKKNKRNTPSQKKPEYDPHRWEVNSEDESLTSYYVEGIKAYAFKCATARARKKERTKVIENIQRKIQEP